MSSGPVLIVASTRDRAAVGRGLLGALAAGVAVLGLLVHQFGGTGSAPPPQLMGSGNALVVPAAANGECRLDLWIGDALFRDALADSGANGFVTIGLNQAKRAGIDIRHLQFDRSYESAHGRGRYAETRIPWIRIGNAFDLRDVTVDVTEVDQPQALIGIEILRYYNFRLRGDRCELSWWPT
jgi:clan AA aspartic protease (TIGR02281 family)